MKKLIFEKYKILNLLLLTASAILFVYINTNYKVWFQNADIEYIYNVWDGTYHPLMVGSMWLSGILAILVLLPSLIFKKWLFFVAPPILILTYVLVSNISVYSDSVMVPMREKMTENMMVLLAIATALLVAGHLLYNWKKKRKN